MTFSIHPNPANLITEDTAEEIKPEEKKKTEVTPTHASEATKSSS